MPLEGGLATFPPLSTWHNFSLACARGHPEIIECKPTPFPDTGEGEIEPLSLNVICMKNKIKIYSNHVTNFGRHGPHTKKEGNPTPNGRKFHFFSLLSGHIFRQKFSPSTGVGGHYPGQRLTMWVNWWSRSGNRNSKFFFILWFILILSIFTEEASSSSSGEKLFRSLGRN